MNKGRNQVLIQPEDQLKKIVSIFSENIQKTPGKFDKYKYNELEVRFTNKYLTKIDYDNVIKKLLSLGFNTNNEIGNHLLRISNTFIDRNGNVVESNIRTEIEGLHDIKKYCDTNNIDDLVETSTAKYGIKFNKKMSVMDGEKYLQQAYFNDLGFRVSYNVEESVSKKSANIVETISNWNNLQKSFRYINRVSYMHKNYPFIFDISVVKTSSQTPEKKNLYFTNIQDSKVFDNVENYEIEFELDPKRILENYNSVDKIISVIKKGVKYVLSGLQHTNYPTTYSEQNEIISEYMKLLHGDQYDKSKRVRTRDFIGPNSYTLQIENIIPENILSESVPNIRKQFTVTDKADGLRNLLFISKIGKIYLIDTSMKVIFTGSKTLNERIFNTLLDGELILHNKNKDFINLYAAFDAYYINGRDIRALKFDINNPNDEPTRYSYLINIVKEIDIKSFTDALMSPFRISYKKFYSVDERTSIFENCGKILDQVDTFEYNTDGLIINSMNLGVGSNKIGEAGKLTKETWMYSFKWKPVEYNTIDFLVITKKNTSNQDEIKTIFEEGVDMYSTTQLTQYKTIILNCGYDPKKHGYENACQMILDDKFPSLTNGEGGNNYYPTQFYPSNPVDLEAGICNIILQKDMNNEYQMLSEENEVIKDNMIVEFKYDITRPYKWRWVPLRVRYDKTAELRRGEKNFGNAYNVADSNWRSIHNPITIEMISTGANIPEEVANNELYYNRIGDKNNYTTGLRNFHNLYVKKILISGIGESKGLKTLIDYACGKAGDLSKWVDGKYSFIFGVDIFKDNIENRLDGACTRYINFNKESKDVPKVLFVNGDSSKNIKSGEAMFDEKAKLITRSVFGDISGIDVKKLGKGVMMHKGEGVNGFDISSCQFAVHYFFENIANLHNFIRNVCECTKLNGYFIGTTYDGERIFEKLKDIEIGGNGIEIFKDGIKIWQIIKSYSQTDFPADETSLGYKIEVYQESIGTTNSEYLINFTYFIELMRIYGFEIISKEELRGTGLQNGTSMFRDLYNQMMNDKKIKSDTRDVMIMRDYERDISFLNRYFIFKKVTEVDSANIANDFISKVKVQRKKKKPIFKKIPITFVLVEDEEDLGEEISIKVFKPKFKPQLSKKISCDPNVRIAIIVPFRDLDPQKIRTKQLEEFKRYMNEYFNKTDCQFKLFIITQSNDERKFNRGKLLNIGFKLADEEGYTNFIFHDVDLLPSPELLKYYMKLHENPVHIARVWDRYAGNPKYFGGIVAFTKEQFDKINGFPNNFWGWGGEDDEMQKRTIKFYDIIPATVGTIKDLEDMNLEEKLEFLKKEPELKCWTKNEVLSEHDDTWKNNGLVNLNYDIMKKEICGDNCELIIVDILLNGDKYDDKSGINDTSCGLNAPLNKKASFDIDEPKEKATSVDYSGVPEPPKRKRMIIKPKSNNP